MIIETKRFGRVEYDQASILTLDKGLIGISEHRSFILIEKDDFQPFAYLQSVEDPAIALVVINPFLVEVNYKFCIHDDDLRSINARGNEDFLLLAIVVFADQPEQIMVNLKAPLLMNVHTKRSKQVILLNDDYSVSEPSFKPSALANKPKGGKVP